MLSVEWRYLYPQGSRSFRRGPSPREKASGKKKKKICKCAIVTSCVLTSNKKNHCISISHTHTLSLTHTHSHTHSHTHTHTITHTLCLTQYRNDEEKLSKKVVEVFLLFDSIISDVHLNSIPILVASIINARNTNRCLSLFFIGHFCKPLCGFTIAENTFQLYC